MTREAIDFIREESATDAELWADEGADIVAECDGCEEPIRAEDDAMSIVIRQGNGEDRAYCLCDKCLKVMSLGDAFDALGILYFQNDAKQSVSMAQNIAAQHNVRVREQFRRTIMTAAQMVKGVKP